MAEQSVSARRLSYAEKLKHPHNNGQRARLGHAALVVVGRRCEGAESQAALESDQ